MDAKINGGTAFGGTATDESVKVLDADRFRAFLDVTNRSDPDFSDPDKWLYVHVGSAGSAETGIAVAPSCSRQLSNITGAVYVVSVSGGVPYSGFSGRI